MNPHYTKQERATMQQIYDDILHGKRENPYPREGMRLGDNHLYRIMIADTTGDKRHLFPLAHITGLMPAMAGVARSDKVLDDECTAAMGGCDVEDVARGRL